MPENQSMDAKFHPISAQKSIIPASIAFETLLMIDPIKQLHNVAFDELIAGWTFSTKFAVIIAWTIIIAFVHEIAYFAQRPVASCKGTA